MDQAAIEGLGPVSTWLDVLLQTTGSAAMERAPLERIARAQRSGATLDPPLTDADAARLEPLRANGVLIGPANAPQFAQPAIADLVDAAGVARQLTSDYVDRGGMYDRAIAHLSRTGMPAAPLLVELLGDAEASVANGAAHALGGIGAAATPALRWALLNGNARVRAHALDALMAMHEALPQDDALVDLVVTVADDDDHGSVRLKAVGVLGLWRKPAAIEALKRALTREGTVGDLARIQLGAIDLPEARRALEEAPRQSGPDREAALVGGWQLTAPRPRRAQGRRPRVFLSYAREDAVACAEYRRRLELAGLDVWIDSSRLVGGERWDERIRGALQASDFAVVLVSPHTFDGYQREELKLALAERPKRSAPFMVPICLSRAEYAGEHPHWPEGLDDRQLIVAEQPHLGSLQLLHTLGEASTMLGLPLPPMLRDEPRNDLQERDVWRMVFKRDFFSCHRNPDGIPPAGRHDLKLVLNEVFVDDRVTGLCWTRHAVATVPLLEAYRMPGVYREALRERFGFGGPKGLRLPTLEEAMSLMAPVANAQRCYRHPWFSGEPYMLTKDTVPAPAGLPGVTTMVWVADFGSADAAPVPVDSAWPVWLVASTRDAATQSSS
jgi:hypothetical protein